MARTKKNIDEYSIDIAPLEKLMEYGYVNLTCIYCHKLIPHDELASSVVAHDQCDQEWLQHWVKLMEGSFPSH
jgi:hypothetical protein